jgi:hypothetical protein
MKAKKTNIFITTLTVMSALGAGLGTLPIPSADLPLFSVWPESRAYVMSAGFFGLVIRMVAVAIRDSLSPNDKP